MMLVGLWLMGAVAAHAQTPGNCRLGRATADLDIGNVRARLYNTGGLFWNGAANVYNVPKAEEGSPISPNAVFAQGIWIGGRTGPQIRLAAQAYGNWEYWPGPLDENGNPPSDCSKYDHIYLVSRDDIAAYDAGGDPIPDLANWPADLGAPVVDGDGVRGNYNLEGGDRPDITGDQMAWWIMNDVGAEHENTGTPPIGIEIRVSAFAFAKAGDIGNATFYRYELTYRGKDPFTDAWFGIYADMDLGNATDDYVGSDTTLGMGYTYNADNIDEGGDGYGSPAPAIGIDFVQGPLVPLPGNSYLDPDGTRHVDTTSLTMTRLLYYNGDSSVIGNPRGQTTDWYNYLQGIWQDNVPMCEGGVGHPFFSPATCSGVAHFMFAGDPVTKSFWSEFNVDGDGTANPPSERRFLMSTGPFEMQPGDTQVISFGMPWARGLNNIDSITKLRRVDAMLQRAYDAGFRLPDGPDAPLVTATPQDGGVMLSWRNAAAGNNYLESFEAVNPFSLGPDFTYDFEGYEVYQFPSDAYNLPDAELLAVYDIDNGVERVRETTANGLVDVVARGTDSGIQHHHRIEGLNNYTEYYFGVLGYAYNGDTETSRILRGPLATASAVPGHPRGAISDSAVVLAMDLSTPDIIAVPGRNIGDETVSVDVVDPAAVVDADYTVRFYNYTCQDGPDCLTYDVLRDGTTVLDGSASDIPLPLRESVAVFDGLRLNVAATDPGIRQFLVTANASGPLDPPEMGTLAINNNGFPTIDGSPPDGVNDRPSSRQQSTGVGRWVMNVGGGANDGTYATFLSRSLRNNNIAFVGFYDYEMRFTAAGGFAYRGFNDGVIVQVPFELWRTGVATPDDSSDDVRLIPIICEDACGAGTVAEEYDLGSIDHGVSDGSDDPFTDWVYFYTPEDESTGSAGYDAVFDGAVEGEVIAPEREAMVVHEVLARTVLVNWDGGAVPGPYNMDLPEEGTVFRIVTHKPAMPGDTFSFSTRGLGVTAPDAAQEVAALEDIGIVPNPYKGGSSYEVNTNEDLVRFTGMPEVATIRVFSVSGTLVTTLEKNGPETYFEWDLTNDHGRKIGSGVYLVHVDVPGVGSRIVKFGVVIGGTVVEAR